MLVLFLGAYVFLNKFISPEFIKEKVSKTVSQKIHRDVLIGGNLSWSLFPRIKISIHDVKLGNPANFQGSHPFFLEVSKLDLGLNPFELIRKRIEVNYLAVDGLNVFLFVNNQGQNSWDLRTPNEKSTLHNNRKQEISSDSKEALLNLNIGSFVLNNVNVFYEDKIKNKKIDLKKLHVNTSGVRADTPFKFISSGAVDLDKDKNVQFDLSSNVLFASDGSKIQFDHFSSKNKIQMPGMLPVELSEQGKIIIDVEKKYFWIQNFQGQFDAAVMKGSLEGSLQDTNNPSISGTLMLSPVDPKRFFQLFKQPVPVFQNSNALGRVSAEFQFHVTPNVLMIHDMKVKLDDSTVLGSVGVADLKNKIFQFDLNLDQVDMNRYTLKSADAGVSKVSPSSNKNLSDNEIKIPAILQQLSGFGSLSVDAIQIQKMPIHGLSINLSAKQGVYMINPLKMKFAQGNYIGRLQFNSLTPTFGLKGTFLGIDAQTLMASLKPVTRIQISGKADVTENLTTQGKSKLALLKNLNGNVLFVFQKGVLQGIDLPYYVALGKSLILNQTTTSEPNTHQTEFGTFSGSFDISQGIASNKDFLLQGPHLQGKGGGTVDLVNQKIDFQLSVTLNGSSARPLPLVISGPFDSVLIYPDIKKMAVTQINEQVQKQLNGTVGQVLEKNLGKESSDVIKDALGNLFH